MWVDRRFQTAEHSHEVLRQPDDVHAGGGVGGGGVVDDEDVGIADLYCLRHFAGAVDMNDGRLGDGRSGQRQHQ